MIAPADLFAAGAAGAAAAAAVLLALLGRRALRRWRVRLGSLEETVLLLRRDLELAADAARRLEALQAGLVERLALLESRRESGDLDQAILCAQRGAAAPQLAERFGLSRGEAELLARVHGVKRRA